MLKRKGEAHQHSVPGYAARLTDAELVSYNAAFARIENDFKQIEKIKGQLTQLDQVPWGKTDVKPFAMLTTQDGKEWQAQAKVLDLPQAEILLCRQTGGDQWGIVEQLNGKGQYAQTQGQNTVVLTGNNPRELVQEYTGQAEHTLRFMARNLTAQAQDVVWNNYPDQNPDRVMRAISQRCALAVDNPDALHERQTKEQNVRQSRGMSI